MKAPIEFKTETDGERLDKMLAALFPEYTRTYIQRLIEGGSVSIEGYSSVTKKTVPKLGDKITVELPETEQLELKKQDIPLDIAYEDGDLLVVNKQKGMVVHPAPGNPDGTLVNALLYYCNGSLSGINGVARPGIVHRIDKDTSGLLIVAKNDFAHQRLAELIKLHDFTRQYEAIVVGSIKDDSGTIAKPIGRSQSDRKKMTVTEKNSKYAETHYEVLARYRGYTHLRLTLETGRTHQIRVHMASIGHPVVCDTVYGSGKAQFPHCVGQCLHARRIAFVHPRTGEKLDIVSELPDYFTEILDSIKRYGGG
ncbi:MAG: RluA family pseudouridine synthase [Oscillospiraceae bacterium]|jgi:23S rRNA pseudouridine1911/1915/1917 synthase|nr:RluA family pseudouridine synthase [Oscillospiraceae bacterium]